MPGTIPACPTIPAGHLFQGDTKTHMIHISVLTEIKANSTQRPMSQAIVLTL